MRWGFCVFPSRLFVHTLLLGANPSGFRGRFRRLRALLPVGAGCAQARVAYWRVCSARQTTARTRRRELHARPQARWRSNGTFACELRNPAKIATRLSKLQRSSPNCGFLSELRTSSRIARFSCEPLIYSRMAACLCGRRSFRPTAVIPPEQRCFSQGSRVCTGLQGAVGSDIGVGRNGNFCGVGHFCGGGADDKLGLRRVRLLGLTAGATAVSTADLRRARGGGELGFLAGLPIPRTMREMLGAAKLCGRARYDFLGNTRSLADDEIWKLKMLSRGCWVARNCGFCQLAGCLADFGICAVWLPSRRIGNVAMRRKIFIFGGLFAWNFFHGGGE